MIRLIALDLDGTLLGPTFQVGDTDRDAVVAARDRGVLIVLNTARWYGIASRTARRLALSTPLICHNGVHVQYPDGGEELLHLRIPAAAAREIAAFCDDGGFETYTTVGGTTYMRTPYEAQIDPARLPSDMVVEHDQAARVTADVTGFVVFGEEAVPAIVDAFAARFRDTVAFPEGISERGTPYLTITATGADKGTALTLVCERLGVDPKDALAIGDATPDLAMFAVAGTSVAMGNGSDDVKAAADAVAPTHDESGVAWALRRYVLGES